LLCLLLIVQVPAQISQSGPTVSTPASESAGQVRATLPYPTLPNFETLVNEGKSNVKKDKAKPVEKPSTGCGHRDLVCKELKKIKDKKAENSSLPTSNAAEQIAGTSAQPVKGQSSATSLTDHPTQSQHRGNWLTRLGRKLTGAISSLTTRNSSSAYRDTAISIDEAGNSARATVSSTVSSAVTAPPAPPPVYFSTPQQAMLDARYQTGSGEDLFSGNYSFSLPLVSLPGRNGLDLNLTLNYNSLVWTRSIHSVYYDYDYYPSLTPGFRLGFPELKGPYSLNTFNDWIAFLPSGSRVGMYSSGANTWESMNSSHLYLRRDTATNTMILSTPDGTQFRYTQQLDSAWRCVEVKDSNGNFLTITYKNTSGSTTYPHVVTDQIRDTLGRIITFNYDEYMHLLSITQTWKILVWNPSTNSYDEPEVTHTWAQFEYTSLPMTPNFTGITVDGPTGGQNVPFITKVITGNGVRHKFEYNGWGIVDKIRKLDENDTLRTEVNYVYPATSVALTDSPRYSERKDYIIYWGGQTGTGWASTFFSYDANEAWGQRTGQDGVTHKEFYTVNGGQRGLLVRMETIYGGAIQKFTETTWETSGNYNPPRRARVTDVKVVDDQNHDGVFNGSDKIRRTETVYSNGSIKLPIITLEYNADGTSVYRSLETEYRSYNFTWYRLIGLPRFSRLYQGDIYYGNPGATLVAQSELLYDSANASGFTYLNAQTSTPIQHDSTNYGTGFTQRGNVTQVKRYSVVNGVASSPTETRTGYHTTGTVKWAASTRDQSSNQWQISTIAYTDAFTRGYITATGPTFAYPTSVTDADGFTSAVKYHYDFGGVTETIDPKNYAANPNNPPVKNVNLQKRQSV
jgi:hypothetical protein